MPLAGYVTLSSDWKVSLLILSLSFALMWLAHSQREWTGARKCQSLKTGQNQRLLSEKVTDQYGVWPLLIYLLKIYCPLVNVDSSSGSVVRSTQRPKITFLTLTPSIHGCWNKKKLHAVRFFCSGSHEKAESVVKMIFLFLCKLSINHFTILLTLSASVLSTKMTNVQFYTIKSYLALTFSSYLWLKWHLIISKIKS